MTQLTPFGKETLTPPERMHAILTRQRPDRVPFIPFLFGFCARNVGYPVHAIYEDPERSFWAQMWTAEMFGYDGGPLYGYASFGGWEFGGDIKMPTGEWESAPVVSRFPVISPEDVADLPMPDVNQAGAMPIAIAFSKMQQQLGMPVTMFCGTPFTVAGNVCEVSSLCRWLIKKPDAVHLLLRKTTDFLKSIVDYYVEAFSGHPILAFSGSPTEANQVISAKQFEAFALPYVKELHQYIIDKGIRNIFCHICGNQNLNLDLWADVPFGDPGLLSFGHEVELERAIEVFGDRHVIMGNVSPTVLQTGSWQEVYSLSRQCIEKGKQAPSGYVLMAGCEVPVMAPPYNIYAMKKAVMDHGFYE